VSALVESELSPLSRLAFHTEPGTVGGPLEDGDRFLLILVEELHAPRAGSWAEIGAAVEQSLAERPLDETEYRQWELFLDRVHAPDLAPFFELAGEPLAGSD
jgi:hypothetical protein